MNVRLETERLIIRPFTEADIEPSYEMNLDEEVSRYTGDGGVVSREEIERRIKENVFGDYQKHGYGRMAVELKGGEKFIGFSGLKYYEELDEVELGFRFFTRHWGKGFATESGRACVEYGFDQLKLKRIVALILPENAGSIRVVEKLGFRYEKEFMEEDMLVHQYVLQRP